MKLNRFVAIATLVIAAMGVASGTTHAAPRTEDATHWNVTRHGQNVVVATDNGTLSQSNGQLRLHNRSGRVVETVPLIVAVDDYAHPVVAQVTAKNATLRLDTSPALSRFQPVKHKADLQAAVSGVRDNITLSAAIGGYIGAASGLTVGCILGAVAAGVVSAPAVLLFGAGPLAGCIGGALLLGAGASLAGTAIGGIGAAIANAGPFFQLLNQPKKKDK